MKYSIKNLKSFEGRQGYGYSCTIYKDGKKIGTTYNEANGGCSRYDLQPGEKEELLAFAQEQQGEDYCEAHDIFIMELIDDLEMTKKAKRSKTKTFAKIKINGEVDLYTFKAAYSVKVEETLKQKYGKDLIKVYEGICLGLI